MYRVIIKTVWFRITRSALCFRIPLIFKLMTMLLYTYRKLNT